MRLSEHLDPGLVLTGVDASDGPGAIRIFSRLLSGAGDGIDPDAVERELLERERSHSTSMGQGVAIPHAAVEGVPTPLLLVARAGRPIPFGPAEDEPVWLFFVLVSPPGREREHIRILARICRLIRDPDLLEELRGAGEPEEIVEGIDRFDRRR